MTTEKVKLSQVFANKSNPRTITDEKLNLLVTSIIVLPKMLELRPIVVDEAMSALGGNMRLTALNKITTLDTADIFNRLTLDESFQKKTEAERQLHVDWWAAWLDDPFCYIVRADSLTEEEQAQFIVKDNVSFGSWDWHKLTKQFEPMKLRTWGMDNVPNFAGLGTSAPAHQDEHTPDAQSESFVEQGVDTGFVNLPPELAGLDIQADKHEEIKGDDKVEFNRIIITYRDSDSERLAALLGIASLEKVVYNLEELLQ